VVICILLQSCACRRGSCPLLSWHSIVVTTLLVLREILNARLSRSAIPGHVSSPLISCCFVWKSQSVVAYGWNSARGKSFVADMS
jgi:hypothetical protein